MPSEVEFRFDGTPAIVTGAAGLIGSAIARAFASSGASVALVDLPGERLDRFEAELSATGAKVLGVGADLTDPASAPSIVERVEDRFGVPMILVNNAGRGSHQIPEETTLEEWSGVLQLNLTGYFLMAQAFGRNLIAHHLPGSIVSISSTCAGPGAMGRGNFVFSVSKAGVNHMTKELAIEWGALGIRANAIQPSQVDSPGMRAWMEDTDLDGGRLGDKFENGVPMGRLVKPEDIAGPVLFLSSPAAGMVTGSVLPVDGGNLSANVASTIRRR
jgi:NAD(P)-dependent dehydrogenase (short-subunit alcohol dehydrogenase family)